MCPEVSGRTPREERVLVLSSNPAAWATAGHRHIRQGLVRSACGSASFLGSLFIAFIIIACS
eukprot:5312715-Alexandrium_andersonii.AAC.1